MSDDLTTVTQTGTVTPGHVMVWTTTGVAQDGGVPNTGAITEMGIVKASGTALGIATGVAPASYSLLGFGFSSTTGNAQITLQGYVSGTPPSLEYVINGVTYAFPGPGNGDVAGPGSAVSGNLAAFSGTSGKIIDDAGYFVSSAMQPVVEAASTSAAAALLGISTAMQPVVAASTVRSALDLLGAVVPLATIAALQAFNDATTPPAVYIEGYTTAADGGQGVFVYVSTDVSSSDNGGTIIVDANSRRWYRDVGSGAYSVLWFGAKCDSATDNQAAFQSAVTAATSAGRSVYAPGDASNYYLVATEVSVAGGLEIYGDGAATGPGNASTSGQTRIIKNNANNNIFHVQTSQPFILRDIFLGSTVAPGAGAGAAVLIEGSGGASNGNSRFRNVSITNNAYGLKFSSASFWNVDSCYFGVWSTAAIYMENTINNDAGDNFVVGCKFFGDENSATEDSVIRYINGGAITVSGCKFLGGKYHFRMTYDGGPTGTVILNGNSFEQFSVNAVSLALSGSQPFGNIVISNNEISTITPVTPQSAIAIQAGFAPWISQISIQGNVFNMGTMDSSFPLIDAEDGLYGSIQSNVMNCGSTASTVAIKVSGNAADWTIANNRWFSGGAGAVKYDISGATPQATVVILDLEGVAFGDLPSSANGSWIFVTDGTLGSSPLTGGGSGTIAKRLTSIWIG